MAVLFDVYDSTGGQTIISSGADKVLNLDTIREEEPSGSASPFDLTSDTVTISEAGLYVFHYRVTCEWSSTDASTAADGFSAWLTRDTGSGFAMVDGSRCLGHPETGTSGCPATASASLALTVDAGDEFQIKFNARSLVTFATRADASGLMVWKDTASGASSGAPTDSQYVTLATDSGLSNERVLTAGQGVALTDAGAGSTVTAALNFPGLAAYTTPDLTIDYLAIYDDTAKAHKRILAEDFIGASMKLQALQVGVAALTGAAGSAGPSVCVAFASHVITAMTEAEFAVATPTAAAKIALDDFIATPGAWRMVGAAGARAVERALLALAHWESFPGDPAGPPA